LAKSQNFFVVVRCKSTLNPDTYLNGTRITLLKGNGGGSTSKGWQFSICAASTPERFVQYEQELKHVFDRLIQKLVPFVVEPSSFSSSIVSPVSSKKHVVSKSVKDKERYYQDSMIEIIELGLEFFYYWINFTPLSRGTSFVGYTALYSCILVATTGLSSSNNAINPNSLLNLVLNKVPKDKQLVR
jgi:hypothetical protein